MNARSTREAGLLRLGGSDQAIQLRENRSEFRVLLHLFEGQLCFATPVRTFPPRSRDVLRIGRFPEIFQIHQQQRRLPISQAAETALDTSGKVLSHRYL